MSEQNGQTPLPQPSLDDAADMLYQALASLPWFVGIERDHVAGRLIVEARHLGPANQWNKNGWCGWPVTVRLGRAVVRRKGATT